MKSTLLATAAAAALTLVSVNASAQGKGPASKAELQAVQEQMNLVMERLNRLEAANDALQAENTELKSALERRDAEMDYLKAEAKGLREETAVAANEISKVKGADWATRIRARGDFRFRTEHIETDRVVGSGASAMVADTATRDLQRIRVRLGLDAQVTEHVKATLLLATGGDDPRSSNQTLGTQGTRKSIGVDMAYADWNVGYGANVLLGKHPWPIWRPGNSLFFDSDYNPEGGAIRFERGMLFGSAYGWWLSEQFNPVPEGENSDGNVFGAQIGAKFALLGGETRIAAQYYDCGACRDQASILYNNNANGNTTYRIGTGTTNFLKYDYQVLEIGAEMGLTALDQPVSLWVDYARNLAADVEYDTAYSAGVSIGRASNPKTWSAALWYENRDADALFGQFVDSDFGGGRTDTEGWVLRGSYAPVRNFTFLATYYLSTLNKDVAPVSGPDYSIGKDLDYDRLQVDFNYKF